MKTILRIVSFALILPASSLANTGVIRIVAAENFYGGVAQEIAGSSATVKSILTNPNQDPHEFTSSAATAKAVADADIVIYSGISYDPWMDKLLGTEGKPGRVVINVADLIGGKDGDNPHIWYDPKTMPALADQLAHVLAVRTKSVGPWFSNAAAFKASMKPELDKIAAIKASSSGLAGTATEPVFGYMADALGFRMLNYDFQVQVMNDAEPTADQTAGFEKSLTSKTAKILFYNSQVTDPTTARIQDLAKKSGVPIVGVTETQPPDQKSYVAWMLHELDGVQAALGAKSQ
jgi:zinc/manganese transport system substrate-binding protein